jgi:hypothetical protein
MAQQLYHLPSGHVVQSAAKLTAFTAVVDQSVVKGCDTECLPKTNSVVLSLRANYTDFIDRHLSTKFSANFCG